MKGSLGQHYVTIFKMLTGLDVNIRQIALIVKPFFRFQRRNSIMGSLCQSERNFRGVHARFTRGWVVSKTSKNSLTYYMAGPLLCSVCRPLFYPVVTSLPSAWVFSLSNNF